MKVIKWINYEMADDESTSSEFHKYPTSVGGLGGFFKNGMRWPDYISEMADDKKPYLEAIRESIIETGRRTTGNEHQYGSNGVPVFEDNTKGSFSFRAWADLMAATLSTYEDQDYSYIDFYM